MATLASHKYKTITSTWLFPVQDLQKREHCLGHTIPSNCGQKMAVLRKRLRSHHAPMMRDVSVSGWSRKSSFKRKSVTVSNPDHTLLKRELVLAAALHLGDEVQKHCLIASGRRRMANSCFDNLVPKKHAPRLTQEHDKLKATRPILH